MQSWWKGAAALILSLTLTSAIHAVQVYDIANPSIQKTVLVVKAVEDTAKNQALVERLKKLLGKTLLFRTVDEPSGAEFSMTVSDSVESGRVVLELEETQGSGKFKAIRFGVSFRKQDDEYLGKRAAQIGNVALQKLFGLRGALGSSLVWSELSDEDVRKQALMEATFGEKPSKTRVSHNLYGNAGVTWNPKGNIILYTAQTGSGNLVLAQLFRPLRAKSLTVYDKGGKGSAAAWGANGKVYIAEYVSRTNTDIFEYSIPADPYQAKDPSMLRLRKLTSRPSIETEPAVSPDGKQLAYISDRTGKPQIYLMDLGSKKVSRLTQQGAYNTSPAWSPDGSFIAFSARRSGGTAIFRINVATGAESQVTPFDIEAEDPTWSPDGSMIAFTGIEGMARKIYYSLSSGGGYQRLTASGAGVYESKPAWGGFLR